MPCADLDRIAVGDTASCELAATAEAVAAVAALTGDDNPLHMEAGFAAGCGFLGRVAHGLLTLGAVSRLIGTQLPGPGSLWMSQTVDFVAPVHVGERLDVRVTVQMVSRAARVVVLATEATKVGSGEKVLRGTARVRIPQSIRGEASP